MITFTDEEWTWIEEYLADNEDYRQENSKKYDEIIERAKFNTMNGGGR